MNMKLHNEEKQETNKNFDDPENIVSNKPLIGYRWVFAILGFLSNVTVAFNRNSLSISLVAMVNSTQHESESNYTRDSCPAAENNTLDDTSQGTGEFNWSTSEQGLILAASTWGFLIFRLFGSRFAERIGQRETVGIGLFVGGIMVLASPFAAEIGPYTLAASRFIFGAGSGPIPSALHGLISAWASREELSSMVTTVLSGYTFGALSGVLMSGWLSEEYGWETTFWIGGSATVLFVPIWFVFVRNSPQKHPWISEYERKLLETNKKIKTQKAVPWLEIMTSPYLYICVFSHFARIWMDFLISIEGPSFLTYKIGLDLNQASYVCAANQMAQLIFIIVYGRISDLIVRKHLVKKITARKLFHVIGTGGIGLTLTFIAIADCNTQWVIALIILTGVLANGTGCSYFVSVIDLTPNYTGILMGFFALGNIGGAVTPLMTSYFLNQGNGWNKSYYLAAALNFASCIIYVIFMTDEVQSWNFKYDNKDTEDVNELDQK